MPVVTNIVRQKRSEDRFSVYVDGVYAFALGALDFSASGLRVGVELSDDDVKEYQEGGERAKIHALALRFLSYRPRSSREILDHLRRKGWGEEAIQEEIGHLESAGLLNDREFAAGWIANRQMLKPRSRRQLEQELAAKGLAREDVQAALAEAVDQESELAAVIQTAQKKRRLPQYQDPDKLRYYLARQGYSFEVIKKALERLDED